MRIKLIFSGDRKTHIIKIGQKIQKFIGKKLVHVELWDGYKSRFYLEVRK